MRQGLHLIASVHTALDDPQLARFQRDLIRRIGEQRTRMVIIDVAALDVVDSFTAHILSACATMARLRGAELTVVGIQPDVALTMVELGLTTGPAHTALDLQDGMDYGGRPRSSAGLRMSRTLARPAIAPQVQGVRAAGDVATTCCRFRCLQNLGRSRPLQTDALRIWASGMSGLLASPVRATATTSWRNSSG